MKLSSFLLLSLAAIALTSCTTLANRRDLYRYGEGSGPWTHKLKEMTYRPTIAEWKEQRRQWKEYERWRKQHEGSAAESRTY